MGMFDTMYHGDYEVQVKTYDNILRSYLIMDDVYSLDGESTYKIETPQKNFVLVSENKFIGITDDDTKFLDWPVFDKWGMRLRN